MSRIPNLSGLGLRRGKRTGMPVRDAATEANQARAIFLSFLAKLKAEYGESDYQWVLNKVQDSYNLQDGWLDAYGATHGLARHLGPNPSPKDAYELRQTMIKNVLVQREGKRSLDVKESNRRTRLRIQGEDRRKSDADPDDGTAREYFASNDNAQSPRHGPRNPTELSKKMDARDQAEWGREQREGRWGGGSCMDRAS